MPDTIAEWWRLVALIAQTAGAVLVFVWGVGAWAGARKASEKAVEKSIREMREAVTEQLKNATKERSAIWDRLDDERLATERRFEEANKRMSSASSKIQARIDAMPTRREVDMIRDELKRLWERIK